MKKKKVNKKNLLILIISTVILIGIIVFVTIKMNTKSDKDTDKPEASFSQIDFIEEEEEIEISDDEQAGGF